jgi:membrane protein DedA with SNARE-associated domain
MEIGPLIRDYGYLAVLVVNMFEGETIVLLAGAAVHFGLLDMPWVLASGLAGCVAGDQLWYFIGRRWGPRILALRRSWEERAERVHRYLRRHQDLLIFTFRFYYGLRAVTPFAIGSAQVPRLRFFVLNFASAVLWTLVFAYAGYFLGGAAERVAADRRYVPYALGGTVLLVIAIFFLLRARRRSKTCSPDASR